MLSSLASIAAAAPSQPAIKWNAGTQGKFITALCQDHRGNLWVGTEDKGVWEYHTTTQHWQQFTVSSTGGTPSKLGPVLTAGTPNEHALGDNDIYAIACDRLGRIWVGHLNHGVSVYNSKSWRNYDVINGPLGERVFDIATCPVNGDVWIATDEGLTRYSLKNDSWSYYTRGAKGKGLPSNQIQAIAFAKDGTLYAATQCHGLAICKPTKNYQTNQLVYSKWRTVSSRFVNRPPLTPMGHGLPTNLLNDVMVAHDGTIWVATDEGLAWSRNKGQSWQYVRGRDWEAKDKELYRGPSDREVQGVVNSFHASHLLLAEDYVTCLDEDRRGYIWLGHWRKGVEVLDPRTGRSYRSNGKPILPPKKPKLQAGHKTAAEVKVGPRDYVFKLLTLDEAPPVVGFYGGGLIQMPHRFGRADSSRDDESPAMAAGARPHSYPNFPKAAQPPSRKRITGMVKRLRSFRSPLPRVGALYIGDDWMTQGDWFGRYGRDEATLCAAGSPLDHQVDHGLFWYTYSRMGPHHRKGDTRRSWVHWLTSDNEKVLWDPTIGHRRQASWDDHGETYPPSFQGPDLWCKITVPQGIHLVTLYFFNKDGHGGSNRCRDYLVDVLPFRNDAADNPHVPVLARARVHNFWGGVYKQFLIHAAPSGPKPEDGASYLIHIRRNYSFNTVISLVAIDRLKGPSLWTDSFALPWTCRLGYKPPALSHPKHSDKHNAGATETDQLWSVIHDRLDKHGTAACYRPVQLLAYRRALASHYPSDWLTRARWQRLLWNAVDRRTFARKTRKFWDAIVERHPALTKHPH